MRRTSCRTSSRVNPSEKENFAPGCFLLILFLKRHSGAPHTCMASSGQVKLKFDRE